MRRLALLAVPVVAALAFASGANAADTPPGQNLIARTSLPPGESGNYTATGQAQYELDHNPGDFGANANDQADYWQFQTKPANFQTPTGTPATPTAGVRIYRDSHGVPQVYGDNAFDTWFGDGYAAATDRLFEADAVRRTAEGTLAELTGQGAVPADIAERTVFYTDAELDQQFAALTPTAQTSILGYTAGMQQRISEVNANPTLLPIEYTLLTQTGVEAWTKEDTLSVGVYLTRDVAVQGGGEMDNVAFLKELEAQYGQARGRAMFEDFLDNEDPKAAVTIADKTFSNLPPADRSAKAQAADFQRAANFADTLPVSLASGVGTVAAPVPPAVNPALPGVGALRAGDPVDTVTAAPVLPARVTAALNEISQGLENYTQSIHGGSFAFAVAGNKTKDGHALLVSEPQLDYSYPGLLWESEVHGGGYNARGVNVPGLPSIGIGWNQNVAWGLTTGYSKNIDSYIETTRANPVAGGPEQYLHDGQWLDETCRTETIDYRTAEMGVPAGPASNAESYQVCRTIHGPIIAVSADGTMAHSVDYADWGKDIQTLDGILDWDSATSLADIETGVKLVTWNENIMAADSAGNIGYWHPGLYFRRANGVDQRFPVPGTGAYDPAGFLTYDEMPHEIDPPDGYLANWNTQPAHGWVNGDLASTPVEPNGPPTTTRPGGPSNRVVEIQSLLAARNDFSATDFQSLDAAIGESDFRAAGYLPLIKALVGQRGFTATETAAINLLAGWDGRAYAPGQGSSPFGTPATSVTDGAAPTLFAALVPALQKALFGGLPADLSTRLSAHPAEGHQYDVTPLDNLVERVLRPGYSGLTPSRDYTGGQSVPAIVKAALDSAITSVTATYGADPAAWRRPHAVSHLNSLSDVVGPTGETEPFEDRGSWVELIAFTTGKPYAVPAVAKKPASKKAVRRKAVVRRVTQPTRTLAFTGLGVGLPVVALGLLVLAFGVRRRRAA